MRNQMVQGLVFVAMLVCSHAITGTAHGAEGKPNVLLIVADDLGYGELGCYGQKVIQTPRLDLMAKEGLRFTHFYAGATVCAPSRSEADGGCSDNYECRV